MTLEYDGTAYHGWQVQPNGTSIQEVLQNILKKITKKKVTVIASGRTDAGVHAEAQVAHFVTDSRMKPGEFLKALNSLLPNDIVVKEVKQVSLSFHAQTSALRKTYRYTILNREYPSALSYGSYQYVPFPMDVPAMRRAIKYLQGRHDFTSFRGANCSAKFSVREIYKIAIKKEEGFIHFSFEGNGFLKHMIRNIMGTLIEVGRRKLKASQVREILRARNRTMAGPTAQPQGLCLVKVTYKQRDQKA